MASDAQRTPASDEVANILRLSAKATQTGKVSSACELVRMLTRHYPHDIRPWVSLAELAETSAEREAARVQVQRLQAAARTPEQAESAAPIPPVAPPNPALPAPRSWLIRRSQHWLAVAAGVGLLLLLFGTIGIVISRSQQASSAVPFQPALSQPLPDDGVQATGGSGETLMVPTVPLPPTPTVTPTPVPRPALLTIGTAHEYGGWRAVLLRPDYAQVLNETIGGVPPRGRFALVVLSVGNLAATPQTIPPRLFALVDNRGQVYYPVPSVSSAYLLAYGRGQHGDLALEDPLPSGGGLFSVPLVFDVSTDVAELILTMGQPPSQGWLIFATPGLPADTLAVPTPGVNP